MRIPTQSEIDEAKQFLLKRLDAELSMRNNLMDVLSIAANRIIAISYKYNVPPRQFSFSYNTAMLREIDEVIDWLLLIIEEYTEILAVAGNDENRELILAYISREQYGNTFHGRLTEYISRFRGELQAFLAAAYFLGLTEKATTKLFGENIENPLFSDVVKNAISKGSDLIPRLGVKTSYGKGRRTSASGAMTDLTTHAIAEGWKRELAIESEKRGTVGWVCFRGSSYPCSQCDDECSYIHTEWDSLPPFHGHCKCFAVPITL